MRVLIADDDSVNRRILEGFLEKWGYEVLATTDGTAAWNILQAEDAPRLVILDWMMPGMDGAQICREIRKRKQASYTYIMLVTAKFQKHDILEGLEAGADDYLTKPFDSSELRARLRTGRRILDLQEELLGARTRLEFEASHDAMTGAWNHAAILEILEAELARARRLGHAVGVLLADLDRFKLVNDSHGHQAGDAVLVEVVRRLRSQLRPYDAIGRYGGEEFLIVLPQGDPNKLLKQADRLRLAIAESPVDGPGCQIPITISIGVTAYRDSESTGSHLLIQAADAAMYRAKERGRNRVEGSTPGFITSREVTSGTIDDPAKAAGPVAGNTAVSSGVALPPARNSV